MKDDRKRWLPQHILFESDRDTIESDVGWLNDGIVYAAQRILEQQCNGKISGWMSPQMGKRKEMFNQVRPSSAFVQVLHVGGNHGMTVSNVCSMGTVKESVMIYDSALPRSLPLQTKKEICSLLKPKSDTLHFDVVNVQAQTNNNIGTVVSLHWHLQLR